MSTRVSDFLSIALFCIVLVMVKVQFNGDRIWPISRKCWLCLGGLLVCLLTLGLLRDGWLGLCSSLGYYGTIWLITWFIPSKQRRN